MIEHIITLSRDAGAAIMQVYNGEKPLELNQKQDDSPVTTADLAAHRVIAARLQALAPDIPLFSERIRRTGPFVSIGAVSGWWTPWTAPRSFCAVTVNLRSISR